MSKNTTGIKSTPVSKSKPEPEVTLAETKAMQSQETPEEAVADVEADAAVVPDQEPEAMPEASAIPESTTATALIEVPLGEVTEGEYLSTHIESRLKTQEQKLAMKRLLRGLQESGATTKDGRAVQRPGEAIRWLLESIYCGDCNTLLSVDSPGGPAESGDDLVVKIPHARGINGRRISS